MIKATLVLVLLMAFVAQVAAEQNFYRYTDENGTVVINSSIAPNRASKGYEVLDQNGRVIKVVAPALTGDQLSSYLQKQEQAKKQEQYDISLLQRYSFVSDIESAQKREVTQLNTRSAILRGNLSGFRVDLERAYEQAADAERRGQQTPDKLKSRIASLEDRISTTEAMLNAQQKEIDKTNKKYQKAIERFKQLDKLRGRTE